VPLLLIRAILCQILNLTRPLPVPLTYHTSPPPSPLQSSFSSPPHSTPTPPQPSPAARKLSLNLHYLLHPKDTAQNSLAISHANGLHVCSLVHVVTMMVIYIQRGIRLDDENGVTVSKTEPWVCEESTNNVFTHTHTMHLSKLILDENTALILGTL
jgi:hypothetical protein